MRALAVLLLLPLAGCTGPPGEPAPTFCGQLDVLGSPDTKTYFPHWFHNATYQESPYDSDEWSAPAERGGSRLEVFQVRFEFLQVVDQRMTVTAFRDDDGRQLDWTPLSSRPIPVEELVFGPGSHGPVTYHIALTDGGPTDVRAEFWADQDLDGDASTDSYTSLKWVVTSLYRRAECPPGGLT